MSIKATVFFALSMSCTVSFCPITVAAKTISVSSMITRPSEKQVSVIHGTSFIPFQNSQGEWVYFETEDDLANYLRWQSSPIQPRTTQIKNVEIDREYFYNKLLNYHPGDHYQYVSQYSVSAGHTCSFEIGFTVYDMNFSNSVSHSITSEKSWNADRSRPSSLAVFANQLTAILYKSTLYDNGIVQSSWYTLTPVVSGTYMNVVYH